MLVPIVFLTVMCAAPASAGRNANGALIVHTNDAVSYIPTGDYCQTTYLSSSCEDAVTRTDRDENTPTVIWLLAAFPDTSLPAVTAIQFGSEHNLPANEGYFEAHGKCAELEVPDAGWPETGFGNLVSFGSTVKTDLLFPFYWFTAYVSRGAPGANTCPTRQSYRQEYIEHDNSSEYANQLVESAAIDTTLSLNGNELWIAGRQIHGPYVTVRLDGDSLLFNDVPLSLVPKPWASPDSSTLVDYYGNVPRVQELLAQNIPIEDAVDTFFTEMHSLHEQAREAMRTFGGDSAHAVLLRSPLVDRIDYDASSIYFKGIPLQYDLALGHKGGARVEPQQISPSMAAASILESLIGQLKGSSGKLVLVTKFGLLQTISGDSDIALAHSQINFVIQGGSMDKVPTGPMFKRVLEEMKTAMHE
jgi:hypothetical protein